MTGIVIATALALVTALAILLWIRSGRTGWEPVLAALLVGLAGYAWQGRPGLSSTPAAARDADRNRLDEGLVQRRQALGDRFSPGNRYLILSDGLARQGDTQDAANILSAGLRAYPRDPELWVGLGNALFLHAEGVLSPSADYAYRQALRLSPASPSARYFYGLALAQSGKLQPARALWVDLAAGLREGTPFRLELERNILTVDRLLAGQGSAAQGTTGP